jgi:hypothetical protein
MIFTVTTGRSGTNYLTDILACFPGVHAVHEPYPRMEPWMHKALRDPSVGREFWEEYKLPAIDMYRKPIYAETSHLFCKGFLEPLLELEIIPDIVLLRRAHRKVAASLYSLDTIPGRTELGRLYYLSPDDPVLLPLPGWEKLHDYQLCYWYCLEIEKRRQHYGQRIRALGGRVVEADLENLSYRAEILRLGRELALPAPGLMGRLRLHRLLGRKVNTKTRRKSRSLETGEMAALEAEVLELTREWGS